MTKPEEQRSWGSVGEELAAISSEFFAKFPHLHPIASMTKDRKVEIEVGEDTVAEEAR